MQYRKCLPQDRIFGWEEVKHMPKGKYLLMHSMIYRTKLLHECNLELPKHTFYVDNLFAFEPLPYVKNLYYLDVNFYRYFIGRDDQSVNEKVMIKRIDQQIRVNKLMVDAYINCKSTNKQLKAYMFSYLDIITTISSLMLIRANKEGMSYNLLKGKRGIIFGALNEQSIVILGRELRVDALAAKAFRFVLRENLYCGNIAQIGRASCRERV